MSEKSIIKENWGTAITTERQENMNHGASKESVTEINNNTNTRRSATVCGRQKHRESGNQVVSRGNIVN